jgi:hypothetical protein
MNDFENDQSPITHYDAQAEEAARVEQKEEVKEAKPESSKEQNHRILRERAEAAERKARDLEYQLQMRTQQQEKPVQRDEEDEDDFDISDDSYVEGRQVKKILKKMDQKIKSTKQQFEEMAQKSALKYAESNLKSQFNDFDSIVTEDNLQKLKDAKAPLFRSIMANPDFYDRGYSAYEAIKSMGIVSSEHDDIDRKIEENNRRPRSSSATAPQTGDTPLSRVGDYDRRILTPERKEQLRKQVEQAKMYR